MSSLSLPDARHAQYRRAIRHPQPAEREYLAAQCTGTGVHVGKHVEGAWLVDAAMAESPAEEAGIVRGDRIIEISKPMRLCQHPSWYNTVLDSTAFCARSCPNQSSWLS